MPTAQDRDFAMESSGIDIVDTLWKRVDDIKKARVDKQKADTEYMDKLGTLDLDVKYKLGVGASVSVDPRTGKPTINLPQQPTVPPIAIGQAGYGMAMAGQDPNAVAQGMQNLVGLPPGPVQPVQNPNLQIPVGAGGSQPQFLPPPSTPTAAPTSAPANSNYQTSNNVEIDAWAKRNIQQMQQMVSSGAVAPADARGYAKFIQQAAAKAALARESKGETEAGKAEFASDLDFQLVGSVVGDLVRAWKAGNAQVGGSGPVHGIPAAIATGLKAKGTGAIKAYNESMRTGAIVMARLLSGGSRGAVTLFQNIIKNWPSVDDSPGQAGSVFGEVYKQAYALRRGATLVNSPLQGVDTPEAAEALIGVGNRILSNEQSKNLNEAIQNAFDEIEPMQPISTSKATRETLAPWTQQQGSEGEDEARVRAALSSGNYKIVKRRKVGK